MRIQFKVRHNVLLCMSLFLGFGQGANAQNVSIQNSTQLLSESSTTASEIDDYLYEIINLFDLNADSSFFQLQQFIELADETKQRYALAEAYNLKGQLHLYQAEFNASISSYQKALEVSEKNEMPGPQGRAFQGLGAANEELGKTRIALEFYFEALRINQIRKDTLSIADTYNNIGSVYLGIKDFNEAALNFEQAISLMKGKEQDPNFPIYLSNLGNTYENSDDYNKALEYYRLALELDSLQMNTYGLAYDYFSIGELNNKMKNDEVAYNALQKALLLSDETANLLLNSRVKRQLSEIHIKWQQYDSALYYADAAYKQSIAVGNPEVQKESAKVLSHLYERAGELVQSNTFLREYVRLSEQLINQEKIKAITRMEAEFDFDREREQRERVQRLTLAVLALFVLLLIATVYSLYTKSKYNKKLVNLSEELSYLNQNLEIEVEKRTKALKERTDQLEVLAEINSHSLRASLSQIMGLTTLLENLEALSLEESQNLVNHINTAANRMDETVRSMDKKMAENKSDL